MEKSPLRKTLDDLDDDLREMYDTAVKLGTDYDHSSDTLEFIAKLLLIQEIRELRKTK